MLCLARLDGGYTDDVRLVWCVGLNVEHLRTYS